jgi:hypothetical protein
MINFKNHDFKTRLELFTDVYGHCIKLLKEYQLEMIVLCMRSQHIIASKQVENVEQKHIEKLNDFSEKIKMYDAKLKLDPAVEAENDIIMKELQDSFDFIVNKKKVLFHSLDVIEDLMKPSNWQMCCKNSNEIFKFIDESSRLFFEVYREKSQPTQNQ